MPTTAQRIDILKIAVDIAKTSSASDQALDDATLFVFRKLKAEVEAGSELNDTNMSDVKSAVDVTSSLVEIIE